MTLAERLMVILLALAAGLVTVYGVAFTLWLLLSGEPAFAAFPGVLVLCLLAVDLLIWSIWRDGGTG